jgi:chromosome transmission fidelity protein 18
LRTLSSIPILTQFLLHSPIDTLSTYETATKTPGTTAPASRYAVRQVLDQELARFRAQQSASSRQSRTGNILLGGNENEDPTSTSGEANLAKFDTKKLDVGKTKLSTKRDFFGRVIVNEESINMNAGRTRGLSSSSAKENSGGGGGSGGSVVGDRGRIWVTYHEGFSNAVRKPITLAELMEGL